MRINKLSEFLAKLVEAGFGETPVYFCNGEPLLSVRFVEQAVWVSSVSSVVVHELHLESVDGGKVMTVAGLWASLQGFIILEFGGIQVREASGGFAGVIGDMVMVGDKLVVMDVWFDRELLPLRRHYVELPARVV
jgi:hypothetical protein